jgi:hypothetical protein
MLVACCGDHAADAMIDARYTMHASERTRHENIPRPLIDVEFYPAGV